MRNKSASGALKGFGSCQIEVLLSEILCLFRLFIITLLRKGFLKQFEMSVGFVSPHSLQFAFFKPRFIDCCRGVRFFKTKESSQVNELNARLFS